MPFFTQYFPSKRKNFIFFEKNGRKFLDLCEVLCGTLFFHYFPKKWIKITLFIGAEPLFTKFHENSSFTFFQQKPEVLSPKVRAVPRTDFSSFFRNFSKKKLMMLSICEKQRFCYLVNLPNETVFLGFHMTFMCKIFCNFCQKNEKNEKKFKKNDHSAAPPLLLETCFEFFFDQFGPILRSKSGFV